jgi:DNA-binding CsgD family transcriptional regulator
VSDLVAKGLTNQQIAGEMFLSTHTVAFHLRQVFRKLDISSRVDLARVFTEQAQLAGPAAARPANGRPRQERAG